MPAKHPRVRVLASAGAEITVNYGGDVHVYTVENGQVAVAPEHLAAFLRVVEGSSVTAETRRDTEVKE